MAKQSKSVKSPKGGSEGGYRQGVPGKYVERDLKSLRSAESFVPTPAEPVRLRYKMAGGC